MCGSAQRLDVLLVQRASIEKYPPTINQAILLSEAGLRVGILDLHHPTIDVCKTLPDSVKRFSGGIAWESAISKKQNLLTRFLNRRRFNSALWSLRKTDSPRVEIGFDPSGCAALSSSRSSAYTIWHLHEALFGYRNERYIHANPNISNLIVVPDYYRAKLLQQQLQLSSLPEVVFNAPLHREVSIAEPTPLVRELLARNLAIVLYQGAIGSSQSIIEVVESMRYWPANAVLVLAGFVYPVFRDHIEKVAVAQKVASRIFFTGFLSHDKLLELTPFVSVGLHMLKPIDDNWTYSAGASNKRFEYMAAGIPQVTNTGPGLKEMIEDAGLGLCVSPDSPEQIGTAINYLLTHDDVRAEMGKRARQAHIDVYNYKHQFRPVLETIVDFISTAGKRNHK